MRNADHRQRSRASVLPAVEQMTALAMALPVPTKLHLFPANWRNGGLSNLIVRSKHCGGAGTNGGSVSNGVGCCLCSGDARHRPAFYRTQIVKTSRRACRCRSHLASKNSIVAVPHSAMFFPSRHPRPDGRLSALCIHCPSAPGAVTAVYSNDGHCPWRGGNNDRLSSLWREVISLAGVARSFSKASSYRNFQCRHRDAMPD